ncbi:hypothetical protein F5051DRAFT_442781 [Lentinula edodes]|nr:hypothetical protein F5051DRAFT_442781 [Lentinula edodes]KAJ3891431.1 hypothetical protein GG344DRAFT_76892 [Lentinula edodes]
MSLARRPSTPVKKGKMVVVPSSQTPPEIHPKHEISEPSTLWILDHSVDVDDDSCGSLDSDRTQAQPQFLQKQPAPEVLFGTPTKPSTRKAPTYTYEEEDVDKTLIEIWETPELIVPVPRPRPFLLRRGPPAKSPQKSTFPSPSTQYKKRLSELSADLHMSLQRCEALELNLRAASSARKLAEEQRNTQKEHLDAMRKDHCRLNEENHRLRLKLITLQKEMQQAGLSLISQAGLGSLE